MSVYYKEQAENLREAIDSILNQTVKTNEFIIVKDGPLTEKLDNTIKEYVEEYPGVFKIITLEKNMGLAKAIKALSSAVTKLLQEWIVMISVCRTEWNAS